jgi:excisionase family DNA binding protein
VHLHYGKAWSAHRWGDVTELTLPEAAVRLEVSGLELMALVEAGRIQAHVRGGRLRFAEADVELLRAVEAERALSA